MFNINILYRYTSIINGQKKHLLFFIWLFCLTGLVHAELIFDNDETIVISANQVLKVDGNIKVAAGGNLIGASGSQIRVDGHWHNAGTYTHGNGAIYFTGSATSQITGVNTFHTLISDLNEADTASDKTLQFASSTTQTITNLLKIKGDDSHQLVIHATNQGKAATLDLNGAKVDIHNVKTQDIAAINAERWFITNDQQQALDGILEDSASVGGGNNANGSAVTLAQLQAVADHVKAGLLTQYQAAVAAEMRFSQPPTIEQVQALVNTVNRAADKALAEILAGSATDGGKGSANGKAVSLAQLQAVSNHVNANLLAEYQAAISHKHDFSKPATLAQVQALIDQVNAKAYTNALAEILEDSASQGGSQSANNTPVSLAQLQLVASHVNPNLLSAYQEAISNKQDFSNPPTMAQIQALIDQVNATVNTSVLADILEDSASAGGQQNANGTAVSLSQLQAVASDINADLLAAYQGAIEDHEGFSNPPTKGQVQALIDQVNTTAQANALAEILEDSTTTGAGNANGKLISLAQLHAISGLKNVHMVLLDLYQQAIKQTSDFSNPVTLAQVQALINRVNRDYATALSEILEDSSSAGGAKNANGSKVALAQLQQVNLAKLHPSLLSLYQAAIHSEDGFDNPPSRAQLQALINACNHSGGMVDKVLSPVLSAGVVAETAEVETALAGLKQGLSQLTVAVDAGDPDAGYSKVTDLDPHDPITITAGLAAELADQDGVLQVDADTSTREFYIDTTGDGEPDYLWNPNHGNTIEKMNMVILKTLTDQATDGQDLSGSKGYPLGHAKSAAINSSRPRLLLGGPEGHVFRLWGQSDGQFVALTRYMTIPVSGQIEVMASDYIKPLDFGNNMVLMRGSVSLPVALVVSGDIQIDKSANRKQVSVGQTVVYTVKLDNVSGGTQSHVGVTDKLPPGFRYVDGSARYDGAAITPVKIGGDGLHFVVGDIAAAGTHTLQYQLAVGTGVNDGTYTNTAVAVDTLATPDRSDDISLSSVAQASVKVVPDGLFDLGTIMGKVYHDRNGDGQQNEGEEPVANARLYTSAGQQIQVDGHGQYHLSNVAPGRQVIRLDKRSLPTGAIVVGRLSKVADVRPGMPLKVNFGVQLPASMEGASKPVMVVRQLGGEPLPRLHLVSFGSAELDPHTGQFVSPLEIYMHSNFAAFIERWTVTVREEFTGSTIKTFSGDRESLFSPIVWSGDTDQGVLNSRDRYTLQLRVEDQYQRQASTHRLPVVMHAADAPLQGQVSQASWANILAAFSGRDQTERNDIRVLGKRVQISGTAFSYIHVIGDGKRLFTMPHWSRLGQSASDLLAHGLDPVESVTELILPRGKFRLEATSIKPVATRTELQPRGDADE